MATGYEIHLKTCSKQLLSMQLTGKYHVPAVTPRLQYGFITTLLANLSALCKSHLNATQIGNGLDRNFYRQAAKNAFFTGIISELLLV